MYKLKFSLLSKQSLNCSFIVFASLIFVKHNLYAIGYEDRGKQGKIILFSRQNIAMLSVQNLSQI
jgi:hypothetical protein